MFVQRVSSLAKFTSERMGKTTIVQVGFLFAGLNSFESERILAQMRQNPLTNSFDLAIVNVGLGRTAEALNRLEQAHRDRALLLMFLRVDARLASLHGNPRFEALATAMNIPRQ